MMKIFVATIQLVFTGEGESRTTIADSVSAIMGDVLFHSEGIILDWGYTRRGGEVLLPEESEIGEPYEEGDAFKT